MIEKIDIKDKNNALVLQVQSSVGLKTMTMTEYELFTNNY